MDKKQRQKDLVRRSYPWLLALVVILVSYGVYSNAIKNEYNLDDELITNNHAIQNTDFSKMKSIDWTLFKSRFREPYYKDAAGNKYEYRPMVMASFFFEYYFSGKKSVMNQAESLKFAVISHRVNV